MLRPDISMFTDRERELLDDSFYPQAVARRIRGIVFSTLVVVVAVVLFAEYGVTVPWFAAIAVTILVVSAIEKITYQRAMLTYESLIRKLVHRVEQLEGVPMTPESTRPTKSVQAIEETG